MSFLSDIANKLLKHTDYGRLNGIGYETTADKTKEVREKVKELNSKAIDLTRRKHEIERRIDNLDTKLNELKKLPEIENQQEALKDLIEKRNELNDVKEFKYLPKDEE